MRLAGVAIDPVAAGAPEEVEADALADDVVAVVAGLEATPGESGWPAVEEALAGVERLLGATVVVPSCSPAP